jgi:alkanesulfonate monooxygenase
VIFASAATIEQGVEYSADIRRRAAEFGRNADEIFVLPGLTPIVAATLVEARAIYDELNSLLVLDDDVRYGGRGPDGWPHVAPLGRREDQGIGQRNLGALSQRIGLDVTDKALDAVVTPGEAGALSRPGAYLVKAASERTGRTVGTGLTWRDLLYAHVVGGHIVVGGPSEVADYIESWFSSRASDGFNIQSAFLVDQLIAFVELVVPELRRRGLFRSSYEGSTLRDHLGLSRPPSQFAPAEKVSVSR